jgi:ABC-type Co2+ transport system permease subunit
MLTYSNEMGKNQHASILMLDWAWIKEWFLSLGTKYNVNPWLFGGIYVGAIPFFTVSLGWLIKRIKKKESIVLPALSSGFFFISAYLYLIIAGKNVPIWVYIFVMVMIFYGIYSTIKKIKKEVIENE